MFLQAEDRVDELTKDLLRTRHKLHAAEEEKRGKEEEATMVPVKAKYLMNHCTDWNKTLKKC